MSDSAGLHGAQQSSLRDYLTTIRRRKWVIAQAVVLLPAAAIAFSLHQQALYRAHAQVLLSQQNLANQLNGITDPTLLQQPDRIAQTQADLARLPEVARRTLVAANVTDRTPRQLLSESTVVPETNANLLDFAVTEPSASVAVRLVNEYAGQFAAYRTLLDTAALRRARTEVQRRIRTLVRSGGRRSSLYASLVAKEQTLATMQALQTSNAIPVNAADGASRVQPRPVRDALLGLILGVVVGLGAAFLREALDTRIRTPEEIEEQLGLPLLARLPKPDRKLQREDALVMIDDAASGQAEAVRMLRTSLDFARLDRDIRTIVITSAVEQEGKSTTAANLALALASAGHRVALVDGDLRRPYLDRFFEASSGGGLTQVALGRTTLGQALVAVSAGRNLRGNGAGPGANGNGYRSIETGGDLRLLVAGAIPPDAAEFVGSRQVARILAELRESFDTVLIDAPPLLHVGDAMTLGARADAVLLVTRLRLLRRPMLNELRRILESLPAKPLGFVVTGAEAEQGYYGGVYSAYGSTVGTPEKELAR